MADDQTQPNIIDHSRTPSPQKTPIVQTSSLPTPKLNPMPSPVSSSSTTPTQQVPTSSLNIFAPKPFRSTTQDTKSNNDSVRNVQSFVLFYIYYSIRV